MCDMGTTTTATPDTEFAPEQLAAQRLGLGTMEWSQPLYNMQLLRSLAMLQPPSDETARPAQQAVTAPMRSAAGLVRNSFGDSAASMGLPTAATGPMMDSLGGIDRETLGAARAYLMNRFLQGSPIQMYNPDLGRYAIDPKSSKTVTTSEEGTGSQVLKLLSTAAGIYLSTIK